MLGGDSPGKLDGQPLVDGRPAQAAATDELAAGGVEQRPGAEAMTLPVLQIVLEHRDQVSLLKGRQRRRPQPLLDRRVHEDREVALPVPLPGGPGDQPLADPLVHLPSIENCPLCGDGHSPSCFPRISFMISSVPPPIGPRRASRTARSTPYSRM